MTLLWMLSCYDRPGATKAHGVQFYGDVRQETLGRIPGCLQLALSSVAEQASFSLQIRSFAVDVLFFGHLLNV